MGGAYGAAGLPEPALRRLERAENFPVALRVLPSALRRDLRAVYDVVRTIDQLGDDPAVEPARRQAALLDFATDLDRAWDGRPEAPVLCRLVPAVRSRGLDREPFARLVEANLADQRVTRYPTYADLLDYCRLSAEPVGRIVLEVFGASTPRRVELSDRVCSALQLIEHWQDIAEDRRAGRVYLPQEDLVRFGVAETDLDAERSGPRLAAIVRFETDRAADLLAAGAPLVAELGGWARLAIAGYLAGGLAAVDALRRDRADVLVATPRARRRDVARHLLRTLLGGP